jgi:hypothetical protein
MHLLFAAAFLGFLGLGAAVRLASDPAVRRRRIVRLVAYVVVVNLAAGISQRDAWPFTSHNIAVGRARTDARACLSEIVGVDGAGREWRLDPYSWMPMYESVLQFWFDLRMPRLGEAERREALAFLLGRAEASRQRLAADRPIGPARWLGPLGAPYWLLLPREAPSPEPLLGVRVYSECWIPRERFADPSRRTRRLLAEHFEARP